MNTDFCVVNYLRHREQGFLSKYRSRQLTLQQNLITNNESQFEAIRDDRLPTTYKTKAFLIVMSIDKTYFAVATSEKSVGIYCSVSGELRYKLTGSQSAIYTISWHPYCKNIIACSNISGNVFVWDISQCIDIECHFQKCWSWSQFSSITYAIGFHPFRSIMTLARDREIRFVDWEKGVHLAHWRFYSEFSWVPWVSWSFVGSSISVSIGNPQRDCVLQSILDVIDIDQKTVSPIQSGCSHYNNNNLCEICDTCEKMSMLDMDLPTFEEYRVNAVDLIRYILSRPEEWFVTIFLCVDCRFRFQLWAESIQLLNKYDMEANLRKKKSQLPHDIDSSSVSVMESPIAPEVVWEMLQKLDPSTISDESVKKYIITKSDQALLEETKNLLRCIAMFERECLRQSICWSCLQKIHNWILHEKDFPKFLYDSMVEVRIMVMERVKNYDINSFNTDNKDSNKFNRTHVYHDKMKSQSTSDQHSEQIDELITISGPSLDNKSDQLLPTDRPDANVSHSNNYDTISASSQSNVHSEIAETPFSFTDLYSNSFGVFQNTITDVQQKRLTHLRSVLKFLQLYISEPSKLGDLINIFLTSNLNHSEMLFGPSLNNSKIDSYSLRKWHLQPLEMGTKKILPRNNFTEYKIVVPSLIFSGTGLTESSIRTSKCGRTVAVFVPRDSFKRIHSDELKMNDPNLRKRRYSLAFDNNSMHLEPKNLVIAIYSSEPELSCGQLLYYFDMPYDPISLDFSPLGDYLIVGLSGSQNQSYLFWLNSEFTPKCNKSFVIGPPSESHCNIGLILKINESDNFVSIINPKPMKLQQIINHDKNIIYQDYNDLIGWNGPINCVIWNTAGGLLYSKEPGTLFSLRLIGNNNS